MKTWVVTLVTSTVIAGTLALTACNNGGGGLTTTANGNGLIPVSGGAYNIAPNTQIGFYAQTSNFQSPNYYNNGSTLVVGAAWQDMLRDAMGVCDRNHSDGGTAACANWLSGYHDLVFQVDSSTASNVRLTVRSYPATNTYYSYYYSLPSASQFFAGLFGISWSNPAGVFDPMILNATIWPVAANQGFEIRANGPQLSYGSNKLLQLQVAYGKIEDSSFAYKLYWNGGLAASGTMVRCQSLTCGL
jgi:hypothetical protein